MASDVRLTERALEDLDGVLDFIALSGRAAAFAMLERIDQSLERLRHTPLIGKSRHDLAPDVRQLLVRPYLVFYRADEAGILVIRILHERRRQAPGLF